MKKIICLLGVPGSGKTTLGKFLTTEFGHPFFEEKFDTISSVSKEREAEASNFEKCIGFLDMRYDQMQRAQSSENGFTFVDTCFEMTEIYSHLLLNEEEMEEFRKNFNIVNSFVAKPDLYVFLTGNTDLILKRAIDRNLGLDLENTFLSTEVLNDSSNKIQTFLQDKNFIEVDVTSIDLREKDTVQNLLKTVRQRVE